MGDGWISVAEEAIAADATLDFWVGVALAYNAEQDSGKRRGGA